MSNNRTPDGAVHGSRALWWEAAVAVARSGALTPPPPKAWRPIVASVTRHGRTLATLYAVAAARWPDRAAVIDDDGTVTFAELYRHAVDLATDLYRDRGRRPGSVAVLCRNHRGFVIATVAAAMTGAAITVVNTELPAAQLRALLDRHRPEVLIMDSGFRADLPAGYTGHVVSADHLGHDNGPRRAPFRGPVRDTISRRAGKLTLLTSGTTGLAKGVPRSTNPWGIAQLAATGTARIGLRGTDVVAVGPPFFHGFGLLSVIGAHAVGATVVCHRRFDAATTLKDLSRHRVTVVNAVPSMLQRMLADPGVDAANHHLRIVVTGAAPITGATVRDFTTRFGPVLVNGYGSTEAGVVSISTPADLEAEPQTVGTPALGVSIRILDEHDYPVDPGQPGRILVRGPLGYEGYTPDPSAPTTAKKVLDGYVDTGDVGYLDTHGRLFLAGRSDDMIVSGGENVFPGEVEDALAEHPAVTDAVVVGVPDPDFGQVLNAFLVTRPGNTIEAEDVKDFLRTTLERYKIPKRVVVVDEIPRNPNGKVLRQKLVDDNAGKSNP